MAQSKGMATSPRVLYLPNEEELCGENLQVGGRATFAAMAADGTIAELNIYSFLGEYYATGRKAEVSRQQLLDRVRAFKPDILFWAHPQDYPITADLLEAIRNCGSNPMLVYHEADPYDRWYKTLRAPQRRLYRASDVFFTVGLGEGRRLFEEIAPHPHIYHSPTYTEKERFAQPAAPGQLGSRHDAVIIGNIAHRFRFFKHPGSAERVQLGLGLTRLFGDRFASFGNGWPAGTNNCGTLRHVQQAEVIQGARMSLIWEHFPDYSFYYSDRLPIALAAGVPFITSTRPGYDTLFPNVPGLFHVATVEEALDVAVYLRGLSIKAIAEMGAGARAWVVDHLDASVIFRQIFATCMNVWRDRQRQQARPG
jgi:hypothetical protein